MITAYSSNHTMEEVFESRLYCSESHDDGCRGCVLREECDAGTYDQASEVNYWIAHILNRIKLVSKPYEEITDEEFYKLIL